MDRDWATMQLVDALVRMGLATAGAACDIQPLSGGVSCDAFAVRTGGRTYCVKQALAKLRVKADWFAPAARSVAEAKWMRLAATIAPGHVPTVLGEDPDRNLFAMSFFDPADYPVWKGRLAAGTASPAFAGATGALLARLHGATADNAHVAADFANDAQFFALRVEPYLLYTADRHADAARTIRAIAAGLQQARIALMHGDFSPKNILCGLRQPTEFPVILDAETCCYGDPAFDLAFCLNHFLLKAVWHPEFATLYENSFAAFRTAYLAGVTWEEADALESRAAGLLSAFLLARVDGKSPAEYLTGVADKAFVRDSALGFLRVPPPRLGDIAGTWFATLPH